MYYLQHNRKLAAKAMWHSERQREKTIIFYGIEKRIKTTMAADKKEIKCKYNIPIHIVNPSTGRT